MIDMIYLVYWFLAAVLGAASVMVAEIEGSKTSENDEDLEDLERRLTGKATTNSTEKTAPGEKYAFKEVTIWLDNGMEVNLVAARYLVRGYPPFMGVPVITGRRGRLSDHEDCTDVFLFSKVVGARGFDKKKVRLK